MLSQNELIVLGSKLSLNLLMISSTGEIWHM